MNKTYLRIIVFCILFELAGFGAHAVFAESVQQKKIPAYPLVSNLVKEGEIALIQPDTYPRRGEWQEEGFFSFKEADEDTRVKIVENADAQGLPREMVSIRLQHDARYRLAFRQVPAGGGLSLYFQVQDNTPLAKAKNREVVSVYIKILIGQQLIDRIRVTDMDGWYPVSIPLGVIRFLKRPITVDFDIISDRNDVDFEFYGDAIK
ncbi:MAG: hypothetical protein H6757_05020 [Candidatus Omnitrophica bacterium]|nr:hypothetical protein [Candidatus Omnitrophota bacterium]